MYAVDIAISSTGEVKITAEPQAFELSAYFNNISSGTVSFNYSSNKLRLVHTDSTDTTVYLLNQDVN